VELSLPLGFGYQEAGITLAAVIALVLAISACAGLLRDARLSSGAKAMWLVIILFLPIFGSVVYFTVRSDW
jgi:hypothetical protein